MQASHRVFIVWEAVFSSIVANDCREWSVPWESMSRLCALTKTSSGAARWVGISLFNVLKTRHYEILPSGFNDINILPTHTAL